MPDPTIVPRRARVRGPAPRSTTWWGRAFVRTFEETAYDEADLLAGRALARSGRLGAIMVLPSMASAVVDPGTDRAVMAQAKIASLPHEAWATFVDEAARESGHVAALEAGDLPGALVEDADQAGVEILPASGEIETACECDAWVQPCEHALALLYQLAWQLDADPYVLTLLRGHPREWILDEIESRLVAERGPAERDDAMQRAALLLSLAEHAPAGHGLADSSVAAYDEAVAQLLDAED